MMNVGQTMKNSMKVVIHGTINRHKILLCFSPEEFYSSSSLKQFVMAPLKIVCRRVIYHCSPHTFKSFGFPWEASSDWWLCVTVQFMNSDEHIGQSITALSSTLSDFNILPKKIS
jgi:hypothetical protein